MVGFITRYTDNCSINIHIIKQIINVLGPIKFTVILITFNCQKCVDELGFILNHFYIFK